MKKYLFPVLLNLLSISFSQINAVTDSGKPVLLHDNGKWNYVEKESPDKNNDKKIEFDFRKTKWGQSKTDVLSAESAKRIEGLQDDILGYNTTVGGLKAMTGYYFVNDKLWKGVYIFSESHTNKNQYINDYNSITAILKKKYGEPTVTDVLWSNDLYKDDYSSWGFSVSLGYTTFYSQWKTDNTAISLILSGNNYKFDHKLSYESTIYSADFEEIQNQENLNDF
tara:strand:+ start:236 stop:907 length:672 start_codon:yes stop_codon:yes gene_type:complete